MPLYDVEHTYPLSTTEQSTLAIALTDLHATRFSTPRIFVNVRFTDARQGPVVYRGGVLRESFNRIIIRTRAGESRSKEVYDEHCRSVVETWDKVVGKGGDEKLLRTVWVMAALTTALEMGVSRPKVSNLVSFWVCI